MLLYVSVMASNVTAQCGPLADSLESVASSLNLSPGSLIGLLSSFAGVGALSFLAVLPYLMRACRGQDIVTQCLIGKSVFTVSYDATGNGVHAAKKLVLDLNAGCKMAVADNPGQSDSPSAGTTDSSVPNPVHSSSNAAAASASDRGSG